MKISFAFPAVMLALVTGCATHHFDDSLVATTQPMTVHFPGPARIPTTSIGTKLSLLPSAVQHTILACGGTAEIKDISKTVMDQDIYRVQFSNPAGNPTVYIMEDGTLMGGGGKTGSSTNAITLLPPPVEVVLEQQAPHAIIAHVAPTPLTSYEITFSDTNAHPKLVILQDGTVLKP